MLKQMSGAGVESSGKGGKLAGQGRKLSHKHSNKKGDKFRKSMAKRG